MNQAIDRIAEELGETHGWIEQPGSVRCEFVRHSASWCVISTDGASILTVSSDGTTPGYQIPFRPEVPWFVVVGTCAEAGSDCPRCGLSCEGDCGVPDVTVGGEVV